MKNHYSLAVIGAGPAGMAAALTASQHGLDVAVFDEQANAGGQIYRNIDASPLSNPGILGEDYSYGEKLAKRFRHADIDYFPGTPVWGLDSDRCISVLIEGQNHFITADQIIISTGAQERPMPIPGWELPGVMTAGAGQILLKSAGMIPGDGVTLAGTGPLLLLLAWQYIQAGVEIKAILDTTPKENTPKALPYFFPALRAPSYLLKGLKLKTAIRRAGIPVYRHVRQLECLGDQCLQQVRFSHQNKEQSIDTDTLLLHQGVIPQLHLVLVAGCQTQWDDLQQCWQAKTNEWGQSNIDGIFIAGDGSAIIGARAAELHGELCALEVLHQAGRITRTKRDEMARTALKTLKPHLAVRPFLDALFCPAREFLIPPDSTLVCRCEEITAGEVRHLARQGCQGPNQAKSFSRCGMGPCQGRQCGLTVSALIADTQNRTMEDVGYYRVRPPVKPITLGQLGEKIEDLD